MNDVIECSHCRQRYPYKAELAGRQVRCAKCSKTFTVTAAATAAAPPEQLAGFLDEELASGSSATADDSQYKPLEAPPEATFDKPTRPSGKKRRPKKASQKKKSKLSTNLATYGIIILAITWGKQIFRGEQLIRGPATLTFAVVSTVLGIGLIVASFVVGRSR